MEKIQSWGQTQESRFFFFLSDCIYETFQRSKIESFVFHLILLSTPPTSSTTRPRIVPLLRQSSNTIGGLILLMVTLPFSGSQHSVLLVARRAHMRSRPLFTPQHTATCYPRRQMAVSLPISSGFCLLAPSLFFSFPPPPLDTQPFSARVRVVIDSHH